MKYYFCTQKASQSTIERNEGWLKSFAHVYVGFWTLAFREVSTKQLSGLAKILFDVHWLVSTFPWFALLALFQLHKSGTNGDGPHKYNLFR